jgi:glyoxylase-like metal-dependent hydrolase (beta-lactamase superfamily II)
MLEGEGPWQLPGGSGDVEIIHTPGHTRGHLVLLYKGEGGEQGGACFTGDHLAFGSTGGLTLFK